MVTAVTLSSADIVMRSRGKGLLLLAAVKQASIDGGWSKCKKPFYDTIKDQDPPQHLCPLRVLVRWQSFPTSALNRVSP